jgi:hypothetical protein
LKSDQNLFWVAFQSNVLVDIADNGDEFNKKFDGFKTDLEKSGFTFPVLKYNMRNSRNTNGLKFVDDGFFVTHSMQERIEKLKSGNSTVVGAIPIMIKIQSMKHWERMKTDVFKHGIKLIQMNSNKNIVLIHNTKLDSKDMQTTLKRVITDKRILKYPSNQGAEKGEQNIRDFTEKPNHILVTHYRYFNGCEAANVMFVNNGDLIEGLRNQVLRGIENVVVIAIDEENELVVEGMKIDKHFGTKKKLK